jgi:hypothetical protein
MSAIIHLLTPNIIYLGDINMSINARLRDLYSTKWEALSCDFKDASIFSPTHPLLISLPDEEEYLHSDIRIMFVGQETNDWERNFGSLNIEQLQNIYKSFLVGNEQGKSTFWQFIRKWMDRVEKGFPE